MRYVSLLVFTLFQFNHILLFSQESKRGTIKIKKPVQIKYVISKATNLATPQVRTFRVRYFNYNFKEYFPLEYKSKLFPLMFNYFGFFLADAKEQATDNKIISFDYEIFKTQVMYKKGTANSFNLNLPFRELSYMMIGSCVWIKNLAYIDKDGIIHRNEIGEFKIEKVK